MSAEVHVSPHGVDDRDGTTAATAVATITRGVALAAAAGGGEVRVAAGTYTEPTITLSPGILITGGWTETFQNQILIDDALPPGEVTSITSKDDRIFTVPPQSSASLAQVFLFGPDRAATEDASVYGIVVDGGTLALDHVEIMLGTAGFGHTGNAGAAGVGYVNHGGTGGIPKVDWGWNSATVEGGDGLDGTATSRDGLVIARAGAGGKRGYTNCVAGWPRNSDADNGFPGNPGNPGGPGAHGVPEAREPGYLARRDGVLHWVGGLGGDGGTGVAGGGGGGGGAGGSFNYLYWCLQSLIVIGSSGGQGGPGGAPGGGGRGGGCGGAAFGILINDGTVTSTDLTLRGGSGGDGGIGGNGGPGAPGGAGVVQTERGTSVRGCGTGPTRYGGTGGAGGAGGGGGCGGGGAGGNGGPVIHIALVGTGRFTPAGTIRHDAGRPGTGGIGGLDTSGTYRAAPGLGGVSATCTTLTLRTAVAEPAITPG